MLLPWRSSARALFRTSKAVSVPSRDMRRASCSSCCVVCAMMTTPGKPNGTLYAAIFLRIRGTRTTFEDEVRRGAISELFRDAVLFVLRTQHTVNGVRGAMPGFVVVAHLHLAQQSDGEQIQSAEQQAERQHHQRAVRGHDWNMTQKLFYSQPCHNRAAAQQAEQAEGSEEMQRPGKIAKQKPNRDEIEEDAKRSRNAVVRGPTLTIDIANRHFANRRAVPRRQRRNKPVQLAIERHLFQNLAAIGFKRGPEVVNIHAAQFRHQPIGNAR